MGHLKSVRNAMRELRIENYFGTGQWDGKCFFSRAKGGSLGKPRCAATLQHQGTHPNHKGLPIIEIKNTYVKLSAVVCPPNLIEVIP
jgi:hypothetical protein